MRRSERLPAGWTVEPLVNPHVDRLQVELKSTSRVIGEADVDVLVESFREWAHTFLHAQLTRLIRLEWQAAVALAGSAPGAGAASVEAFELATGTAAYWDDLAQPYPALAMRVDEVLSARGAAVVELALRLGTDRELLTGLVGGGTLMGVELGEGDGHDHGRAVARLDFTSGSAHYKPRSLWTDHALAGLVDAVHDFDGSVPALVVPRVITGDRHGWAEHVEQRPCATVEDRRELCRAMGAWMAVCQVLGGSDMHGGNIVVSGARPVVVDVETLFTPTANLPHQADSMRTGLRLVAGSVLRTGMLPRRPTDSRLATSPLGILLQHGANDLSDCAEDVVEGFLEYDRALRSFDAAGRLEQALRSFDRCEVRFVPRPTQFYMDLLYALWHPASLHDDSSAIQQVERRLREDALRKPHLEELRRFAEAETRDLIRGDIPIYRAAVCEGRVSARSGKVLVSYGNLADVAVEAWRGRDVEFDQTAIRTTMNLSYWSRGRATAVDVEGRTVSGESRRESLIQRVAEDLVATAIWGNDGTATWLTPMPAGRFSRIDLVSADLYGGLSGIAVALAAYVGDCARRGVTAVPGTEPLLRGAYRTLLTLDEGEKPTGGGGFNGAASLLWSWMVLSHLGLGEAQDRAHACARAVARAVLDSRDVVDIIDGGAGAIVPLLAFGDQTGDEEYVAAALRLAETVEGRLAATLSTFEQVGFAHGPVGIGWALGRAGLAAGEERWLDAARMSFAFADRRYTPHVGWIEESIGLPLASWCRGSAGIGLAALDVHSRAPGDDYFVDVAHRAGAVLAIEDEVDPTLCHGVLGQWELAQKLGHDRADTAMDVVESCLTHGGRDGRIQPPGLLNGKAGLLYQLLRMDAAAELPSVLLLDTPRRSAS